MLLRIIPVLPAYDLTDTANFYKNKLKFETQHFGNYLLVKKDAIEIQYILWEGSGKIQPGSCSIVADNVEDLFSNLSSLEMMGPKSILKDLRLGKKEFQLRDNNGHVLRFVNI